MFEKSEIKFASSKNVRIFAVLFREHSSVGLEHLPYKQRVGGSTPSAPTKKEILKIQNLFFVIPITIAKQVYTYFTRSDCIPGSNLFFPNLNCKGTAKAAVNVERSFGMFFQPG